MENIFITFPDVKDGETCINVNYITCFRYDSESDETKLYILGFDKPIVFDGDVTDDIYKMIYS